MDPYRLVDGIWRPPWPIAHREGDYTSSTFAVLHEMERRHFWYRGRYRFLMEAVRRHLRWLGFAASNTLRAIDIGGGCGGWMQRLARQVGSQAELAVGDSSLAALEFARGSLPANVALYQLDCTNLGWQDRWDVIFVLDVLEHLPDDSGAMAELARALAPGGMLFVTVPALWVFWTYNDVLAGHRRRYCRDDFRPLADQAGLILCDARYFMFFLSPLLLASRWLLRPRSETHTADEAAAVMARTHRMPPVWLNGLLGAIFALETPLGHRLRFPWGTSLLGVSKETGTKSWSDGSGTPDSSTRSLGLLGKNQPHIAYRNAIPFLDPAR